MDCVGILGDREGLVGEEGLVIGVGILGDGVRMVFNGLLKFRVPFSWLLF